MGYINGVNLLPSTGEFTYDTIAYLGRRATETAFTSINRYANGGPLAGTGSIADYTVAIDNLQAEIPGCTTVAVIVSWFGSSTDISACRIYPSTTYIGGAFAQASGAPDVWRCSGLTQSSAGIIAIPQIGGASIYGGTPSDQSVVRCIRDLKARGLRVVFYPFVLMTAPGEPWRGAIAYNGSDISSAATTAVTNFLGSAAVSDFSPDGVNLTVAYSGPATDYTYRRMILHYANLCTIAGGVDLFLLGSEFRGIETIRGPAWSKAGVIGGDGKVTWDYPFIAGLMQLADDVRSAFDGAGCAKDTANLHHLIAYSADWSVWMGYQHPGEDGQWPHLDQLYGHDNIDLVCFDNYLPLSDWTTGDGGLDAQNWLYPAPSGTWPPPATSFSGLGLRGQPTLYSIDYLKANIEGGEKFNWFYNDSNNLGIGLDPNGTDLHVSLPEGDRLTQSRNPYYPNQQLLANKQLRWWWNNPHQAVYDDGDGTGWSPHGPYTAWVPQSKSITFAEYGFPACDRGTNQPNVFYSPGSVESSTPFWSIWDPNQSEAGGYYPRRDDELQLLALQAIYEYWATNGNNVTVGGVPMIQTAFMSVWNWDARPFPAFPQLANVWGDTGRWPVGDWLDGKGPFVPVLAPDVAPALGPYPTFPSVPTLGWSVTFSPIFSTGSAAHVSGREVRTAKFAAPRWVVTLNCDILRMAAPHAELQAIIGFFAQCAGENASFYFEPPSLSPAVTQLLGIGDGSTATFAFAVSLGAYALVPANVGAVSAVYLNGVTQAGAYTVNAEAMAPSLTFVTPPAAGIAVTANFHWSFLCRFDDDSEDVEEFMAALYALRSLKLRTVRS
ncbi:MAG TPA: glycoside hydrolase TIM-barrel-like domain-containing protein [Xanthobacteraceae bacterium]|nr:glycoside hydrolase TIM-barrel-like domain-containing protein [Xanthobacteraceae bacterium]